MNDKYYLVESILVARQLLESKEKSPTVFEVSPYVGLLPLKFGMSREKIKSILNLEIWNPDYYTGKTGFGNHADSFWNNNKTFWMEANYKNKKALWFSTGGSETSYNTKVLFKGKNLYTLTLDQFALFDPKAMYMDPPNSELNDHEAAIISFKYGLIVAVGNSSTNSRARKNKLINTVSMFTKGYWDSYFKQNREEWPLVKTYSSTET